jgi:hypothetical protein
MIYGDATGAVYSLNTGNIPDNIAFITKLVCGKITKRRLSDRIKLASITTNGSKVINLASVLPDFLDFKITTDQNNPDNVSNIIYSIDSSGHPYFYKLVPASEFDEYTQGGYAKREGRTITFKVDDGAPIPATIYFNYFSFYAWADSITGVEIEVPANNDDICILPSVFDDVIIDGILLYISRKEKESKEFEKNLASWEKSVNELIYFS